MKYIVILADGMADLPIEELEHKTPLEFTSTPAMNIMASYGEMGMVKTIPDGFAPGSDVANLAVLGYDPEKYYTGRSALEAVSIGVALSERDVTYRVNLVTLSDEQNFADRTMVDYSSDEITTEESAELIAAVDEALGSDKYRFYAGTSYRNLCVYTGGKSQVEMTPPHDISGKTIGDFLPKGEEAEAILDLMKRSTAVLQDHPVNRRRAQRGLHCANAIWFWGQGTSPSLPLFEEKYGLRGAMISAVDLLKGIGKCAGMQVIEVEGATGDAYTNYAGKAEAALHALKNGADFVYLHFEGPDESGHHGEVYTKLAAIERIDQVAAYLMCELGKESEPYSIMLLPDHPTPIATRTHSAAPVPYTIFRSGSQKRARRKFGETQAAQTGIYREPGYLLMDQFLQRN